MPGLGRVGLDALAVHAGGGDAVEVRGTQRATEDTPFFHHVASLAELQLAAAPSTGKLYTFHFNALRSIMEKTASFFGHADISFCLKALNTEDLALYNRALNLLSHGKYAIHEPTEMGEDNKELFFSYRGENGKTGRLAAVIFRK